MVRKYSFNPELMHKRNTRIEIRKERVEKRTPTPHIPRGCEKNKNVSLATHKANLSSLENSDKKGISVDGSPLLVKGQQVLSVNQLEDINHDIRELYPQLMKEIDTTPMPEGTRFLGIVTEKKLWKKFIQCYARFYGNISKCCDFVGISRNHFYRARERYPTLALLTRLVDERFVDSVEETTKRHSLLPNSIVERIFLLKVSRKEKYGEDDGKAPVNIEVKFNNLSLMRGNERIDSNVTGQDPRRQLPPSTSAE